MIKDIFNRNVSFLTIQVCILILFKHFFDIEVLNLHLLSFIIFIGGCYLTYVKQFIVYNDYDISGKELHIGNLIFHIIPFIYIWSKYTLNKIYILETLVYVLIYFNICNPKKKYYFSDKEYRYYGILIFLLILIFYIVI